jgi:WD40 repeat protein
VNGPPSIPDHTLLGQIGRGAYGEVWLARNVMGALRAVKIIWRSRFESERPFEREFTGIRQYEPVSRSANGLVQVLQVGRNDASGYFYYVMELADPVEPNPDVGSTVPDPDAGPVETYRPRTLRADLKLRGRLPTADGLRLALDAVNGLAQLHRRGLVHRDVKPGNIIFVNGRAKLADLGLVTADGEGRTFVGTEGYIPPEGPGTPAADLYALGIALYEASTGFPSDRFPDVPPEWMAGSTGDEALEFHEIILKACEGQRDRRYRNAEQIQADLALLQSGQSVRRIRALERRAARTRRFGWAAAVTGAFVIGNALVANWRARVESESRARETRLREAAQAAQARAETAERDGRERLYAALLAEARATVQSGGAGRRFRALEAVRQAAAIRNSPELRRIAFGTLARPDLRTEREIPLADPRASVGLDADFTRFAVARGTGPVEVYDLNTQRRLSSLPADVERPARLPLFSPDGHDLAFKRDYATWGDSDLEVWDLGRTQRVVFASHGATQRALSFHPKAPRLLAGRRDGTLTVWDLERGAEIQSWRLPSTWSVKYSPDGGRFVMTYDLETGGVIEIRDATSGELLTRTTVPGRVFAVSWHSDGRRLIVPCGDGKVNMMNAEDGSMRLLGRHKAQAVRGGPIPGGEFLFRAGWDNELNVWNLRTSQRELTAAIGSAAFQFSGSGRRAAVVDHGRLVLLEFVNMVEGVELTGDLNAGQRMGGFSPDGRWLLVPALDGFAAWDLAQPGPSAVSKEAGISNVQFGSEAGDVYTSSDRKVYRWRLLPAADGTNGPRLEPRSVFQSHGRLDAFYLLRNPPAMLIADGEGLRLLARTNASTALSRTVKTAIFHSARSDDDRWLAAAAQRSGRVEIFRLPDLESERWLTNAAPVQALAFGPGVRALAVLTETSLCLWDTATWNLVAARPVRTNRFGNIAYAPNGRFLMLMESVRSGALVDARTLESLLPLPAWTHPLALSRDGRYLAVGVESRRVQLWDLAAVRARFRELGIDWED